MRLEDHPRVLIGCAVLLAVACITLGLCWRQERSLRDGYREALACERALRGLGPGFENVKVSISNVGRIFVHGRVKTPSDQTIVERKIDEALAAIDPTRRKRAGIRIEASPPESE